MDERYAASTCSEAGFFVDESVAEALAFAQCVFEIRNLQRDVVNAGSMTFEEFGNGSVVCGGSHELDLYVTNAERNDGGSIGGCLGSGLDSENVLVETQGLVEIGDCYAHMSKTNIRSYHGASVSRFNGSDHVVGCAQTNVRESTMAGNENLLEVSDDNFSQEIENSKGVAVVDFWAAWCGPCQIIGPVVAELATDYAGKIKVGKLDVDANLNTATKFNVRSIPTILFFKDGAHVDTVVGAVPKATLVATLEKHLD
jgi:thioredoxin 1